MFDHSSCEAVAELIEPHLAPPEPAPLDSEPDPNSLPTDPRDREHVWGLLDLQEQHEVSAQSASEGETIGLLQFVHTLINNDLNELLSQRLPGRVHGRGRA